MVVTGANRISATIAANPALVNPAREKNDDVVVWPGVKSEIGVRQIAKTALSGCCIVGRLPAQKQTLPTAAVRDKRLVWPSTVNFNGWGFQPPAVPISAGQFLGDTINSGMVMIAGCSSYINNR